MKLRTCKKAGAILLLTALLGTVCLTGCGDKEKDADKDSGKKTEQDGSDKSSETGGWELADKIVKEVADNEPKFGDYEVSIVDFGAEVLTEELTDKAQESELAKKNGKAIADAIADVTAQNDGGTVIIPEGYTYTGPIHLDNNVNVHLEDGANVMFTTDYAQYENVLVRWEGVVCYNYSPMVYAYQKENIAITGNGVLNAQATKEEYWLPWKNNKYLPDETQDEDQKALRKMGEDGTDVEERQFGLGHYLRPSFVQPYECSNVLIEGVTITNAPFWMVQPTFCDHVTVRGITVDSHGYNNDGVNPDSCNNVVIEECTFKTGDDCIAIKSGRDNDGRTIGIPCENVVARNNTYITGKGTCATVGSEMSGDVRNIFFEDSESESTVEHLQAISIKTNGDRGGTIENIYIKGIKAAQVVDRAVLITMHYEEGDTEATTPVIRNIYIEDCEINASAPDSIQDTIGILGYARSPIENVQFKNCAFNVGQKTFNIVNVKDVSFEGCTFDGEACEDGMYDTSAANFTINEESYGPTYISMSYASGAPETEDNFVVKWEVSDSEDGEYTEVANTDDKETVYHTIGTSGGSIMLNNIDSTKYYRLTVTIDGEDWVSDVYHTAQ